MNSYGQVANTRRYDLNTTRALLWEETQLWTGVPTDLGTFGGSRASAMSDGSRSSPTAQWQAGASARVTRPAPHPTSSRRRPRSSASEKKERERGLTPEAGTYRISPPKARRRT